MPQRRVRARRQRAARARSRRGLLRLRHARAPLHRRAVEPVLLPDRLLVRRGDGGRGARAAQPARRSTRTGRPRTRRRSSWRPSSPSARPTGSSTSSSPAAAPSRSRPRGSSSRQYHVANGEPERTKAIARDVAYHGVTLGALSFTGVPGFKDAVRPAARSDDARRQHASGAARRLEGAAARAPARRDRAAIVAEGPETVAMIIAEPVQNAGGCFVPPRRLLAGAARARRPLRILLVADEVISRLRPARRPGSASTRYGGEPDLITSAKGLTSAYAPMGALLVARAVAAPLVRAGRTLLHGITFGGHPLRAAIALKNIEIFEREGVLENVRALEPHLRADARRCSSCRSSATCAAPASSGRRAGPDGDDAASTPTSARSCCAASCPAPCSRPG